MADQVVLSIDIGGSHIKAITLNMQGDFLSNYQRLPTPVPSTPEKVLDIIMTLAQRFTSYDAIAAGFPGYVKNGVIKTAPNLGTEQWLNFDLQKKLSEMLNKPALVINDADFQGISMVSGKGLEMVITLGTGFGTALLEDGVLIPHLELAHHPVTKSKTYDQYIGEAELKRIGNKKWNERMQRVLTILKTVFNYDHLYISGGNASVLKFTLDDNISICGNREGIKGGAKLWISKHKTEQNIVENK